jgi:hypothetical protein
MSIATTESKCNELGMMLFTFQKMLQALEIAAQSSQENPRIEFDAWCVLSGLRMQFSFIEDKHQELDIQIRSLK